MSLDGSIGIRSLSIVPDSVLAKANASALVPVLYDKLPLTDRQHAVLTDGKTDSTQALIEYLRRFPQQSKAFDTLIDALINTDQGELATEVLSICKSDKGT